MPKRAKLRDPEYRLRFRARADLQDIMLYGIENFGLAQAQNYANGLQRCFELLAEHPRMARVVQSAGASVQRHGHGNHVILYDVTDFGVAIVALVHKRRLRRRL